MRFARLATSLGLVLGLLAAPLAAPAQPQSGKVHRVGWLHPLAIPPAWAEAFRQGLREDG